MRATDDTARKDELPGLGTVIEDIGLGPAHYRFAILGGGVWLADGAELLLIGTVTRAVSEEWNINAIERGSVVSIVFLGIFLGNIISGPFGDWAGRRLPILVSYAGIATFSILSTFSRTWQQLSLVRLFVGASFGIGQPAFTALCTEVTPSYWRLAMNAFCQSLFAVGEVYSAILVWYDDPMMLKLNWRWLLLMGAIPSVFFLIASTFFLQDSPSFLASRGRHEEAKAVLESMRNQNRAYHVSVDYKLATAEVLQTPRSSAAVIWEPFSLIFSPKLVFSTCVVIYSCFTLNVLFYGSLYAFPQVLTEVSMGTAPAVSLLMGALWELPGFALAAVAGMFAPRKLMMMIYLVTTMLSLLSFAVGAVHHTDEAQGWTTFALLQGGFIGIKVFVILGFVAVYQYASEIFPVSARTTGTAVCLAGGRIGGMVAPLVFEMQRDLTGRFDAFFYSMAVLCAINVVFVFLLPFESFGKSLDEIQEIQETLPLRNEAVRS